MLNVAILKSVSGSSSGCLLKLIFLIRTGGKSQCSHRWKEYVFQISIQCFLQRLVNLETLVGTNKHEENVCVTFVNTQK